MRDPYQSELHHLFNDSLVLSEEVTDFSSANTEVTGRNVSVRTDVSV